MKVNDPKVMHTDSIHIRPYRDSDRDQVIALWNEVLADGAPHNDPATSIRKKLEIERDLFLVADAASQVVGIAMGGYDGHRGWVYAVAVSHVSRCRCA